MTEHTGAWFTSLEHLKRIGRSSILYFLAAFAAGLDADNVTLPDPNLPDDLYFQAAARFLAARQRRQWLSLNRLPVCLTVPPFTLEPLRVLGLEALLVSDVPGIVKITLCAIKIICSNGQCETYTSQSDDLFESNHSRTGRLPVIPRAGRLTRASFRIQFADAAAPRAVVLCPPQTLQLIEDTDAEPVRCWMVRRGFQLQQPQVNSAELR